MVGSTIPLDPKVAELVADLTGTSYDVLADYDDAGRAIRRWFATMWEPGAETLTKNGRAREPVSTVSLDAGRFPAASPD